MADKGYHSNKTMTGVRDRGLRSYVSEPDWGRRNWKRNRDAQKPTYANRRRIRGDRGKRLLRQRGEKLERASRTCWRREATAAFNLGLLMRSLYGIGTSRGLQGLAGAPAALARHLGSAIGHLLGLVRRRPGPLNAFLGSATSKTRGSHLPSPALQLALCSTACQFSDAGFWMKNPAFSIMTGITVPIR